MPDSTAIDIDAILATLPPRKPIGGLDRWLAEDDERAERFWSYIEAGRARGHGFSPLVDAWNRASGSPCPVKYNQVRIAYREREGRADGRQVAG